MATYKLTSTNLSNLGSCMGTESTSTNFVKYFKSPNDARIFAEKDYGIPIPWQRTTRGVYSGDLFYVCYTIYKIKYEK